MWKNMRPAFECGRSGSNKIYRFENTSLSRFPTDMQSQMMALVSLSQGNQHEYENIFENRLPVGQ
jgi:UDP-N-acetylglucosamine enolpyruvyl transferase